MKPKVEATVSSRKKKKTSDQGAAAGGAKKSARRCCQTKTIYADLQYVKKKPHESRMKGTADDKLASSFSRQKKKQAIELMEQRSRQWNDHKRR